MDGSKLPNKFFIRKSQVDRILASFRTKEEKDRFAEYIAGGFNVYDDSKHDHVFTKKELSERLITKWEIK